MAVLYISSADSTEKIYSKQMYSMRLVVVFVYTYVVRMCTQSEIVYGYMGDVVGDV